MKYPYVVILKKTGQLATDVMSGLLCFISACCFGFIGFRSPVGGWLILAIAFTLLIGVGFNQWARRRRATMKVSYRYFLLLSALGWMYFTPAPWVGALFIVLSFLEYQTKRPLEIGFARDKVVINTLFKQQFEWTAFNNVILKDGLLTLDFKNNRLIQREVADDDEDDDADEEEFNAYCRERLASVHAA